VAEVVQWMGRSGLGMLKGGWVGQWDGLAVQGLFKVKLWGGWVGCCSQLFREIQFLGGNIILIAVPRSVRCHRVDSGQRAPI
jgi:hypothetical protein